MRLPFTRLALAAFLLTALVLAARLAWVASTAETGWETVELSWYNAILGTVGLQREPIGDRPPTEQADVWLREVDRIVAEHPNDPAIAMGAAWILDSPGLDSTETPQWASLVPTWTDPRKAKPFEAKCAARCLELAARATELEPQNVDYWQIRALLLFHIDVGSNWLKPRDPNWLSILDECARHDPDNALYDYLAALQWWADSGKIAHSTNGTVEVHDADGFANGVARFEQGQRKDHLSVGVAALPAAAEFLRHTKQSRTEHTALVFQRALNQRTDAILSEVAQRLEAQSRMWEDTGDPAAALALRRQQQQMFAVAAHSLSQPELHCLVVGPRMRASMLFVNFAKRHPDLVTDEQLATLKDETKQVVVDFGVCDPALQRITPPTATLLLGSVTGSALLADAVLTLGLLLPILGLVGWGVARWLLQGEQPPRLGALRHVAAWALGWGLTLFVLGICPAESLGRDVQSTIITSGTLLMGTAVLLVVFHRLSGLFRKRAEGTDVRRIVAIVAVLTLWQVTVAAALFPVQVVASSRSRTTAPGQWPLAAIVLPGVLLAGLVLLGRVLWLWKHGRRSGRPRREHLVALGLMAVSAFLVGGALALAPDWLNGRTWPPVRGFGRIFASDVTLLLERPLPGQRMVLSVTKSDLRGLRFWWAIWQWRSHAGPYVSPLVSLLIVAAWYTARRRRESRSREPCAVGPSRRTCCGRQIDCLARSALAMGACCLLAYLAVEPNAIGAGEREYQRQITMLRTPQAYATRYREAEAAVRSDPAAIAEIRSFTAQLASYFEEEPASDEFLEIPNP